MWGNVLIRVCRFGESTLFALAPELSPVYHHILYQWKQSHPGSLFGEPSYKGFAGLNSGVVLMNLDAIRLSEEYQECISKSFVDKITAKYSFKVRWIVRVWRQVPTSVSTFYHFFLLQGHLGDQDFYTLLALERPHLIEILPCTWNRQLCEWWRHHGYADTFDEFARCDGTVNIYHGNCNSRIPDNWMILDTHLTDSSLSYFLKLFSRTTYSCSCFYKRFVLRE